jgi:glycine hydroxymethyltransferase
LAIAYAKEIFHADHANVQALSGAAANLAVYNALLQPGDAILGMDLSHGGHLTHGSPVTLVSKIYNFHPYKTENGKINFDILRQLALSVKPKVILA